MQTGLGRNTTWQYIKTVKATKYTAVPFLGGSFRKTTDKNKKATFAKASLVGATTVNGPGPERVSASPAASTKSTSWVAPEKKLIQVDLVDLVGS